MEKFYQVFISSVSKEFRNMRAKMVESVMQIDGFFPLAMDHMSAYDDTVQMLFSYIKRSDIYVLILGQTLGSVIEKTDSLDRICSEDSNVKNAIDEYMNANNIEDKSEITFTELEFIFAKALDIRCGIFVESKAEEALLTKKTKESRLFLYSRKTNSYKLWQKTSDLSSSIKSMLVTYSKELNSTTRGWIRETESEIYLSSKKVGITDFSLEGRINAENFAQRLETTKNLKIMYTTGSRFFENFDEILSEFVSNGGNIYFLCAKPQSDFLDDVRVIEEEYRQITRAQIHSEFKECVLKLQQIMLSAEKRKSSDTEKIGEIKVGFFSTLFRSSLVICESENIENNRGMLTLTLPPFQSKDTISMKMSDSDTKGSEKMLFKRALESFNYTWRTAVKKSQVFDIAELYSQIDNDIEVIEKKSVCNSICNDENYWKTKEKKALSKMRTRRNAKKILIEVAANHPLVDGLYPSNEFKSRLNEAARIYRNNAEKGIICEIYVPGSIHTDSSGIADEISLSESGCNYLKEIGIPDVNVHGEELHCCFSKDRFYQDVYNTADECYIAAKYFDSNEDFKSLISICSPYQVMRIMLFYMEFEVIPEIVSVPLSRLSHNFLNELLISVPYVLNEDHDWQAENSLEALRTRRERNPDWIEK